jgi:hypothetical protein
MGLTAVTEAEPKDEVAKSLLVLHQSTHCALEAGDRVLDGAQKPNVPRKRDPRPCIEPCEWANCVEADPPYAHDHHQYLRIQDLGFGVEGLGFGV